MDIFNVRDENDAPVPLNTQTIRIDHLSKRELFAAMAMQSLIELDNDQQEFSAVAEDAVSMADRLIDRLNKDGF